MVVSCYTFAFEHIGQYYLYNSLSKALLEIDFELYDRISKSSNQGVDFDTNDLNGEFLELLKKNRIICGSIEEERTLCSNLIRYNRHVDNFRHITIAPTLDCCFSCYYCFEKGKKNKYISDEIIDSIVRYLLNQQGMQKLHITWFGGEPLMAINQVKKIYSKFRPFYLGEYSSDMITTAFHINHNTIAILKSIELTEVQITLDGLEETHNRIKKSKECSNVYAKVLENIDLLTNEIPDLDVVIRVNLTKNNANEYMDLYQVLSNRYFNKRVSIAPGYVINSGGMHLCNLFDNRECGLHALDLWQKYKIPSPWLYNVDKTECAIRNPYSIVIDAEGYVYKCWEKLGAEKFIYGKIQENGTIRITKPEVLDKAINGKDPLLDKVCAKCAFLPLCFGGCPTHRFESTQTSSLCISYKELLKEWLISYLEWKEINQ